MGLANTTTNLSYARNELIKVGESFIFDKVADMIWYIMTNDDISTTSTAGITVGSDGTGYDVKFFGDTSGSYFLWDQSEDRVDFVNARQNWTTTALAITDAAGNARQLYGQFTAASIESGEHLTALQLRASWAGTTTEAGSGLTGAEIKARASSNSITDTIGQARAVVGNVDCKKATFTVGHIFEAQADVAAGGTIGTLKGFRASLNNSGTVTTGYAFIVETANTTYNWDYGFYCGTSMADIGLYIGSATTGIQLAGTQTTGIVIGSSVVTGISVDSATDASSTTDGSIHTDGGLGVAKKLYVGSDVVGTKSTGATVNANGIYEILTVSGNCTGSVCGLRVAAETDASSGRTIGNYYGGNFRARLNHASDALSGMMAGLQVAVDVGPCTTGSLWVYGINIDLPESATRATAIKAFIDFQDYDYDGSYPCQHLFDVGGSASRCSTGTSGDIEYNTTLHILVNTSDRYIPLSTAEGTYTTAYPIVLGSTGTRTALTYDGVKSLSGFTTCASGNTGTSYEPQRFDNVLTGANQVGGRFRINMETDVRLGTWSNAFKASVDYKTSGSGAGLHSVACLEQTMMASDPPSSGNYPVLELQIAMPDDHAGDNRKTFIYMGTTGNNKTNWDTYGYFFELNGATSAANGAWYDKGSAITPGNLGEMLRVWTPGGARYIALYDSYTA